ncbi:MAG: hypothetical protein WBF53_04170, partial [Litorimonas sp.]
RKVAFNAEALRRYTDLLDAHGPLPGNFHDLNASLSRLALMADGARITVADVDAEAARLQTAQAPDGDAALLSDMLGPRLSEIDPFDRPQLALVVKTCRESATAAEAGRKLFAVSREARTTKNDGDRVAKYLARFGLSFAGVRRG